MDISLFVSSIAFDHNVSGIVTDNRRPEDSTSSVIWLLGPTSTLSLLSPTDAKSGIETLGPALSSLPRHFGSPVAGRP